MIKVLEISPVLTVLPYALFYYAFLLISSGLALLAINRGGANRSRLQTSLIVILVCQVLLLSINLLAHQAVASLEEILPAFHRGLNLISLVWLVWALFRGMDGRLPEWLPALISILLFLATSLSAMWWLQASEGRVFNFSILDFVWIGLTLTLLFGALIFYLLRFKQRSVEAILVLSIAALGFILYLLVPDLGDLPAIVMLSQLLYFLLLISLAQHESQRSVGSGPFIEEPGMGGTLRNNIANTFLEISLQSNRDALEKSLAHGLSLYLMADLLGFLTYEEGKSTIRFSNTYDLIREDHVATLNLPIEKFPTWLESLLEGKQLLSNRSNLHRPEKDALMPIIGYNQTGNLMVYPLDSSRKNLRTAILALSPYTNKKWGDSELTKLDPLKANIGRLLDKAGKLEEDAAHLNDLQEELVEKTQQIQVLTQGYGQSRAELTQAEKDLEETQIAWTEEVNLWIDRQKELESELGQLQATIEENQENVAQVDQLRLQKKQLEETIHQNAAQAEQLKNTLQQASQLLVNLSFPPDTSSGITDENPTQSVSQPNEIEESDA